MSGGVFLSAVSVLSQVGDSGLPTEVSAISLLTGIFVAVGGALKLFTDHKALSEVINGKDAEIARKDAEIIRREGEADRLREEVDGLREVLQEERELRIQLKQEATAAMSEAAQLKAQIEEGRHR